MQYRYILPVLCCLLFINAWPQQKTNLDVLAAMIDSSFVVIGNLPGNRTELKINAQGQLSVLTGYIQNAYAKSVSKNGSAVNRPSQLIYTIEDARIRYMDIFRDGLFGDVKMVRTASLQGNYITESTHDTLRHFQYTRTDTVALDKQSEIESSGYSFLSPPAPSNTTFGTVWEPAVIVATIGVAVYLLFTVRKTN